MGIVFKKAVRESVGLLIGLSGGTGSGKTYSAMVLASGIVGNGKRFAVIDTENRRALHYADQFDFDHCELEPPFRPDRYIEAILAADKEGYEAIIVDSTSHVWSGDGGVLDWQEEELHRMAGNDWKKQEQCRMASWIKPKVAHKKMVSEFLRVKAHLILCYRAEEKIEMVKNEKGKIEIAKKQTLTGLDGWVPICEKSLPFEHTCSFLLTADAPGVPKPIKLQKQHMHMFDISKPITKESGELIKVWASGGSKKQAKQELTPDHELWEGAIKAYKRDKNFDKIEKKIFISDSNKALIISKCNLDDGSTYSNPVDYDLFIQIAMKDDPAIFEQALSINGLTTSDIKNMKDIQKEGVYGTYKKLISD